jgi:hypothetical protein
VTSIEQYQTGCDWSPVHMLFKEANGWAAPGALLASQKYQPTENKVRVTSARR